MPARKPTAIKKMQGTYRKDRENLNEPVPGGVLGDPPEHLTEEQQAVWVELAAVLPSLVATNADRPAFEILTVLMSKFRSNEASNQEVTNLVRTLAKFGMNPCDRSKIVIVPPKKPKTSRWLK